MLSAAPLKRLMEERGYTFAFLSQITGIDLKSLNLIMKGQSITPDNLNKLCSTLNVQPKDIIEFTHSEIKGHWVYVEEK